jgi:hypothetical protein
LKGCCAVAGALAALAGSAAPRAFPATAVAVCFVLIALVIEARIRLSKLRLNNGRGLDLQYAANAIGGRLGAIGTSTASRAAVDRLDDLAGNDALASGSVTAGDGRRWTVAFLCEGVAKPRSAPVMTST